MIIGVVGTSTVYARVDYIHQKELSNVIPTDNGKFLRVVNGAWEAATVDNANGGSF